MRYVISSTSHCEEPPLHKVGGYIPLQGPPGCIDFLTELHPPDLGLEIVILHDLSYPLAVYMLAKPVRYDPRHRPIAYARGMGFLLFPYYVGNGIILRVLPRTLQIGIIALP